MYCSSTTFSCSWLFSLNGFEFIFIWRDSKKRDRNWRGLDKGSVLHAHIWCYRESLSSEHEYSFFQKRNMARILIFASGKSFTR